MINSSGRENTNWTEAKASLTVLGSSRDYSFKERLPGSEATIWGLSPATLVVEILHNHLVCEDLCEASRVVVEHPRTD